LATTLLLSENYDAGDWFQIRESRCGFIFYPPGTQQEHRINSPTVATSPGSASFRNARPASYHRGGVNAVFASGSGQFLSETIDYAVYCALMTPKGQYAREPGSTITSAPSITQQPPIVLE
jgi:hypothetical protein